MVGQNKWTRCNIPSGSMANVKPTNASTFAEVYSRCIGKSEGNEQNLDKGRLESVQIRTALSLLVFALFKTIADHRTSVWNSHIIPTKLIRQM